MKDFKFIGWHPLCRCYAIPILKTHDELWEDTKARLAGGEYSHESVNSVKTLPENFTSWITKNQDRINRAPRLPLFLSENKALIWPNENSNIRYLIDISEKPSLKGRISGSRTATKSMRYSYEEDYVGKTEYTETQEKEIIRIASIMKARRGKPKTFFNADEKRPNVFNGDENCVATCLAYEYRRRGLDVTANGILDEKILDELLEYPEMIWQKENGAVPFVRKFESKDDVRPPLEVLRKQINEQATA